MHLYNTLSRRLEELVPKNPGVVSLYCCGPTVYDVPHVGHARAALVPDLLVRRLRSVGVEVTYVRNITDVDDKILERAQKNGESPLELSQRMAVVYQEQMRLVGCVDPSHEPRVSAHLPQIFELVSELIANGSAYVVDMPDGKRDVYFAVRNFEGYGKLSRRRLDELLVGARVEKDEHKHDPLDFALWKGAGPDDWAWESPWGRGRPGWHIECSAMSRHYLGHGFDVHTGGMDLIFPHHENELAQCEAARSEAGPFARVWLHNGFVNVDREKMSKSLGNFVTVSDVLERNDPEAFRWFLLGGHYRGPIQFESEQLADGRVVFPGVDEAERRVDYLYGALERLAQLESKAAEAAGTPATQNKELAALRSLMEQAEAQADLALDDDLNTPVALAAVGELGRLANELCDLAQKRRKDAALQRGAAGVGELLRAAIGKTAGWLGLLQAPPSGYAERTRARRLRLRGLSAAEVEQKVQERRDARAARDFARGDQVRDQLLAQGVTLQDNPDGTSWTIAQ
ncbi:MAG TPA: cysteine--tRNA ligase [Polyangiaceae bacterium]|nr:cysteine--tRNA ligase [Polyangiaceae bacterium]